MRDMREGVCAICRHNEVVICWPLEFNELMANPLAASHEVSKWTGTDSRKPLGALYIACCRKCGFAEWFVSKPEELKIGEEYRTQLVTGPKDEGPYR